MVRIHDRPTRSVRADRWRGSGGTREVPPATRMVRSFCRETPGLSSKPRHAADGHLRGLVRSGGETADRSAQDGRGKPIPSDLDRPRRSGRDPDADPGRVHAAADDARPPQRHHRQARCRGRRRDGDRAARQHLLRQHHRPDERVGDRGRLAAVRRDRAGCPLRCADLRRRRSDRGVRDRVRG